MSSLCKLRAWLVAIVNHGGDDDDGGDSEDNYAMSEYFVTDTFKSIISSFLPTSPIRQYYDYPQFTDEETGAYIEVKQIAQVHTTTKLGREYSNLRYLVPELMLLITWRCVIDECWINEFSIFITQDKGI